VNDTFGHKTGDEASPMVGQCLADWLRREAARKGNEDYLAQGRLTVHLRGPLSSLDTRPHQA
jgi:hypothetical protein